MMCRDQPGDNGIHVLGQLKIQRAEVHSKVSTLIHFTLARSVVCHQAAEVQDSLLKVTRGMASSAIACLLHIVNN